MLDRLPRWSQLALLIVLCGLIAAVGVATSRESGTETAAAGTGGTPAATASALCDATSQARDDPVAARATFQDRAHEGVHALARRLQDEHPGTVARMLEAKYVVERDLATTTPAPDLAEHLATLTRAVNEALRPLSVPAACTP